MRFFNRTILLGFLLSIGAQAAPQSELAFPSRRGVIKSEVFQTKQGPITLEYEEINGKAVFQGDILLDLPKMRKSSQEFLRRPRPELRPPRPTPRPGGGGFGTTGSGLAAQADSEYYWPGAIVPYEIDSDLPNKQRIYDAIAHWEQYTPMRFVPHGDEDDYILFEEDDGCSSRIGRGGGEQSINLAAGCGKGSVIHEIGHAVGFFHEQSRADRDTHVEILWDNIESGKGHNFKKYFESVFLWWGDYDGLDIGKYDFGSIMHYGSFAFSKNGQPTIKRRFCAGGDCTISANRTGLSRLDQQGIRSVYCPMLDWDPARCTQFENPIVFTPNVVASATSVEFDPMLVGHSLETRIRIDNRDRQTTDFYTIERVVVTGDPTFSLAERVNPPLPLEPGAWRTFKIRVNPTSEGRKTGALEIHLTGFGKRDGVIAIHEPQSYMVRVPLAVSAVAPHLALAPANIILQAERGTAITPVTSGALPRLCNGADTNLGGRHRKRLLVQSTGGFNLKIFSMQLTGAQANSFSVVCADRDLANLPSGTAAIVTVQFNPIGAGTDFRAGLKVTSDDRTRPIQDVALSGLVLEPTPPPQPVLALSRSSLTYGLVPINGQKDMGVQISNSGQGTLSVSAIRFTGADAAAFSLVENVGTLSLAPGQSREITVRFRPTQARNYPAQLEVVSNAGTSTAMLAGFGYPP